MLSVSLLVVLVSLIAVKALRRFAIAGALKNHKPVRLIFWLNSALKISFTIVLVILGLQVANNYGELQVERAAAEGWMGSNNYAIFYPSYVGEDRVEIESGLPGPLTAQVDVLYPRLNAAGAVYVDATEYETASLNVPTDPRLIRSIRVNPNFLQAYPILDDRGVAVEVSEAESNWVVAVPTRYRDREDQIRKFFQDTRTGSANMEGAIQAENSLFQRPVLESFTQQEIKIVWTANDQQVFSFNPFVFPRDGNVISSPIIEVMTLTNSLGVDRANMVTGIGNDALKVAVREGDAAATMEELRPELNELRLGDNLRYLVANNEYAVSRVVAVERQLTFTVILGLTILLAALSFGVANVVLVYNRYLQQFMVRRTLGIGAGRAYREFFVLFGTVGLFELAGILLILGSGGRTIIGATDRINLVAAVPLLLGVLALELVVSLWAFRLVERRKLASSLKGWA